MLDFEKFKKWQRKYSNISLINCILKMSDAGESGIDTALFCNNLCKACRKMSREQASEIADELISMGAIYLDVNKVNYLFDSNFLREIFST